MISSCLKVVVGTHYISFQLKSEPKICSHPAQQGWTGSRQTGLPASFVCVLKNPLVHVLHFPFKKVSTQYSQNNMNPIGFVTRFSHTTYNKTCGPDSRLQQ